jgi:hypothetical protein
MTARENGQREKPNALNAKGLNLAVIRHMNVEVPKLSLQYKLNCCEDLDKKWKETFLCSN